MREGEGERKRKKEEEERTWLAACEGEGERAPWEQGDRTNAKINHTHPSLPNKKPLPITLSTTTTSQLSQKPFGGFGPSRHPTPVGKEAL